MERANMCGGAGYRNAQRSELLAEHFKKATDIGRESALLGQPAKKFGLATGRQRNESVLHSSADISQMVMTGCTRAKSTTLQVKPIRRQPQPTKISTTPNQDTKPAML